MIYSNFIVILKYLYYLCSVGLFINTKFLS